VFSVITSAMAATSASLAGAYVGTSGWSYPSWRGGFYPADADPKTFLSFYAERFDTVELNTTGYRLPAEEYFARWAEQTPDGFRFAVKMPVTQRLDRIGTFVERVSLMGGRLGPLRVVVQSARDDGLLTFLQGSLPPELEVAYDFRHDSWAGVDVPVRVNGFDGEAPFRYIRLREPPYDDEALRGWAARLRPLLDAGTRVYCYFMHEDEPAAPRYAQRLLELLR
jgi:uncharacterized protein YecE (DUF72 family)